MKEDLFDLFIAYHGTANPSGSAKKALDLYLYLRERGWKPYLFFASDGDGKFTDTFSIALRSRAFLLVANPSLTLDDYGKLKSGYIKGEIDAFTVKMNSLAEEGVKGALSRLRGYVYGGLSAKTLTYARGVFAGSPIFEESNQEEGFASVDAWLRESLITPIGEKRVASRLKKEEKREEGFLILCANEPLDIRQCNQESKTLFDLPFPYREDFSLLVKQMMHDIEEGKGDGTLFSFLLNVAGTSDEYCRIYFTLSLIDPVCRKITERLYQEARRRKDEHFLNFFFKANSSVELFPEYKGRFDQTLLAHNEKKMNIRSITLPVAVGQIPSFSWGRILYSDFIKSCYCDYPFLGKDGMVTTLREAHHKGHPSSSFLAEAPKEVPNEAGVGVILFTGDGKLLLQKRKGAENLMFFHGLYSYASSGSIDTERDYDEASDGSLSTYPNDPAFLPFNAAIREGYEELKVPLEDEDIYLYSLGYDYDACHYQFTYVCFSSLTAGQINSSASKAIDGVGREIEFLYAMDLNNLFRKGEPIKEEYKDLLGDPNHFEAGFYVNLKEILLSSRKVKSWVCKGMENSKEFTREKLREIFQTPKGQ